MIRLMILIENTEGWRVEVVTLAESAFPNSTDAEPYVFNGEGGVADLPLSDGGALRVERDEVEAIYGWEEA